MAQQPPTETVVHSEAQPPSQLRQWIMDKDKRGTALWICSFIGGGYILGYYMTLEDGFTPSVNLGQLTLVLAKAFLAGTATYLAICLGALAPATVYRFCDIVIDDLQGEGRVLAIGALFRRNLSAQLIGALSIVSLGFFRATPTPQNLSSGALAMLCALALLAYLIKAPRLTAFGFTESRGTYWATVTTSYLASLLSMLLLWGMGNASGNVQPIQLAVAWIGMAFMSGLFSTINRALWRHTAFAAFVIVLCLMLFLGMLSWPFRAVAYTVGIAKPSPVTLILPNDLCSQLRKAVRRSRALSCDGEDGGVLHSVLLRNSLGERWNIRLTPTSPSIIFDGKGVVVLEAAPSERAN
jgi:hypothetical protein